MATSTGHGEREGKDSWRCRWTTVNSQLLSVRMEARVTRVKGHVEFGRLNMCGGRNSLARRIAAAVGPIARKGRRHGLSRAAGLSSGPADGCDTGHALVGSSVAGSVPAPSRPGRDGPQGAGCGPRQPRARPGGVRPRGLPAGKADHGNWAVGAGNGRPGFLRPVHSVNIQQAGVVTLTARMLDRGGACEH
jgi:hypothetical protein